MLYDVDFDAKGPGDAEDRGSNLGLLTNNGLVLGLYNSRVWFGFGVESMDIDRTLLLPRKHVLCRKKQASNRLVFLLSF